VTRNDPSDSPDDSGSFSASEWQAFVESAPDLVLRLDRAGVIRFASRSVAQRSATEMVGRRWTEVLPGGPTPEADAAFDLVIAGGTRRTFESHGGTGRATQWWSCSLAPIGRGPTIRAAVVIARDITTQKLAESQLVLADRMASVGVLAAGVAHEINNPLAAVMANVEMALRDLDELSEPVPAEVTTSLRDALEAAGRVRQIVRDLRMFSRADDQKREPVDLRRVIDSTVRMAWNEIRHRARLVVEHGRIPAVDGNESRLGQVFLNLVMNAAQSIPEGKRDENEIRVVSGVEPSGRVSVSVSDTGAGIPPEAQQRLFTPFFSTKPPGVGTGLGLVICQKILTEVGGEISFTSRVGGGTTFRVTLPVSETTVQPPPAREAAPIAAARRGRILVVDDEPALTATLRRLFARQHDVTTENEARGALARFRAGERYDVVLCDLMMPQVTGAELHAAVRELDPAQADRFVFLTGGAFTPGARAALESLSNPQVDKPFNVQELGALVNALVERAR
jgi:PAS domain S-box-containing protein